MWFSVLALVATVVLLKVCGWYKNHLFELKNKPPPVHRSPVPRRTVFISLAVLVALIFSKYIYLVSMSCYYTFYLIDKFHVSVAASQLYLFLFLFAVAAGTFMGGPLGDHFGRKYIIWVSILGVAPFTLLLPHVNLFWTAILTVIIGLDFGVGFFGDPGLCHGIGAGQRRDDQRLVFRAGVWLCGHRFGRAGQIGG